MEYLIQTVVVLFVFAVVMGFMYLLTWMERKQSAVIQDRIGANRAGFFGFSAIGLFQNLADAIKMITKEEFVPPQANRLLHNLSPMLVVILALIAFAVIPFGGVYQYGEMTVSLQILDVNIGLLYIFAVMSISVYGLFLAGWASHNNYALLGSLRASAQMISYEITMGATIIGLLMIYQTFRLQEMVVAQGYLLWGWIPMWGVVVQPLGFILFFTAAMAESKRVPFDVPEGESEIIGFNVEYSGMKFGMFMMTDFVEVILEAALLTTLFFGGWQIPYLLSDGFHFPWGWQVALPTVAVMLLQVAAFLFKVLFFCFLMLLVRWTLPRFRWDQLMRLGWTIMLPISIVNIIVTGFVILIIDSF